MDNPHFTSDDVRRRLATIREDLDHAYKTGARIASHELRGYEQALQWVLKCMESKDVPTDPETNGR